MAIAAAAAPSNSFHGGGCAGAAALVTASTGDFIPPSEAQGSCPALQQSTKLVLGLLHLIILPGILFDSIVAQSVAKSNDIIKC